MTLELADRKHDDVGLSRDPHRFVDAAHVVADVIDAFGER